MASDSAGGVLHQNPQCSGNPSQRDPIGLWQNQRSRRNVDSSDPVRKE
jgi:hypothetical protein